MSNFSFTFVGMTNGSTPWFDVELVGPGRLVLRGELDLAAVPVFRECLSGLEGDVEADCAALTFVGLAGLRELFPSPRSERVRGATLTVVNPSACLVRLLALTRWDAVDERAEGSAA